MEQGFIDILQKLMAEQGKEALLNESKCNAFLADYTKNEYKKESRFLFQALEAGVQGAIDAADDLRACKMQQIKLLHEEYNLDEKVAADVVNTLAIVLRGDTAGIDTQTAYECGEKHYENKDYDKAIEAFSEAIMLDPNNTLAYRGRGDACRMKRQFDRAINDCNEAIRLDPNYARAFCTRGAAYCGKGQYDQAISDCNEAIRLDPNNARAYAFRGDAYQGKGQYDQISDFSEAIRLDPNYAWAYTKRAEIYKLKGQIDKAISDYNEAIGLNPSAQAYGGRGEAYMMKGQFDQAISDLSEAIRLNPNDFVSYMSRGLTYRDKGQNDKAIMDFEKVINLGTNEQSTEFAKNELREIRIEEEEKQKRIIENKRKEQERIMEEEEQRRKQEQSKHWRESGRCQHCGGKLRRYLESDSHGYNTWDWRIRNRKCKSCREITFSNDNEQRKIRIIWTISELFIAILGSLMLSNLFTLIPFTIIFFVKFMNDGFRKFLRITSLIAQFIMSIGIVIASAIISSSTIFGLILLMIACIMAYKRSLLNSGYGNC